MVPVPPQLLRRFPRASPAFEKEALVSGNESALPAAEMSMNLLRVRAHGLARVRIRARVQMEEVGMGRPCSASSSVDEIDRQWRGKKVTEREMESSNASH